MDLRGHGGDRDQAHAQVERLVADLVLDGVSGLVRGHAERGQAGAPVVRAAQGQALVHRVIVVAELAADFDDVHVGDPGLAHDGRGRLGPGDAPARADLAVLAVSAHHTVLRPQAQDDGRHDEHEPQPPTAPHGDDLAERGKRRK
jgi:hypothetical protein